MTVAFASSSLAEATSYVPLAQSVEHLTFNQRVWSSNLQRDTIKKIKDLGLFFVLQFLDKQTKKVYTIATKEGETNDRQ